MTLPANDSFTLGLPHDHARIALHSSTKIPFVSPKPRSPSATVRRRVSQPRQMSVELPDPPARSPPPQSHATNCSANGAPLRQRKRPRTSTPSSSSLLHNGVNSSQKPRQKVDWEIPRKTLHSSIGMSPSPAYNHLLQLIVSVHGAGFLTWYLYASDGNPRVVVYALSLALLVIVPADIVRLNSDRFEWLFERVLGFLMRESEKVRVLCLISVISPHVKLYLCRKARTASFGTSLVSSSCSQSIPSTSPRSLSSCKSIHFLLDFSR